MRTSSKTWTVVSNRKYTGNITIQYQLLRDEKLAASETGTHYDASWLGMADAYRDYLIDKGVLTELTEEDVTEDIPLYMEVFGAMKTQQTVATIPVNLMTPFTTFDNVLDMYKGLSESGVSNINFKLTGGSERSAANRASRICWKRQRRSTRQMTAVRSVCIPISTSRTAPRTRFSTR